VRWPVSAERVEGRLTSNARCLRAAVSSMVCLVGFWVQSWISGSNLDSNLDFEFNIVIFSGSSGVQCFSVVSLLLLFFPVIVIVCAFKIYFYSDSSIL